MILTCVGTQIAKEATNGTRIIDEEDIEMRPEMVSLHHDALMKMFAYRCVYRKYCTEEAWGAINSVASSCNT